MLILKRFLKVYDNIIEYMVFLLMIVALFSVTYGILSRIFLFLPFFVWTEELSRYCIVTMIFIIAGLSMRRGIHLGLDILPEKLTGISHKLIITFINTLIIIFLSILAVFVFINLPNTTRISPGLNLPLSYMYTIMLVGLLLMMIETFCITLMKWKEK